VLDCDPISFSCCGVDEEVAWPEITVDRCFRFVYESVAAPLGRQVDHIPVELRLILHVLNRHLWELIIENQTRQAQSLRVSRLARLELFSMAKAVEMQMRNKLAQRTANVLGQPRARWVGERRDELFEGRRFLTGILLDQNVVLKVPVEHAWHQDGGRLNFLVFAVGGWCCCCR